MKSMNSNKYNYMVVEIYKQKKNVKKDELAILPGHRNLCNKSDNHK